MEWNEGYIVDTEYTAGFYRDLTPRLLQFVAIMQNVEPPSQDESYQYMELGCGQGVSTNLIAACNPRGNFTAHDFNPTHVRNAMALSQDAAVANVTFFEKSFKELLDMDLPEYDYITLHGVYSWVSQANRTEIVEFIRKKLKPGGIVYVSYNAMPGWNAFAPVRRLIAEYAAYNPQAPGGMPGVLRNALDVVGKLKDNGARFFVENPAANRRLDRLREHPPNYLVHEYLNREWSLHYYADVVRAMEDAKLSYVGSTSILENIPEFAVPVKAREILGGITNRVFQETIIDFFVNKGFRRDVFMRGVSVLSPQSRLDRLKGLRFGSVVRRKDCRMEQEVPAGKVTFREQFWGPILDALEDGPQTLEDMMAIPEIATHGVTTVCQTLIHMAAFGYVLPTCPPPDVNGELRRSTDNFNNAILERTLKGSSLYWLASPVLGTGIHVRPTDQFFLAAVKKKPTDVAQLVWDWMSALAHAGSGGWKDM